MLKITVMPIVFMFLASALIVPVGISYAAYDDSPAFTPSTKTSTTTTPTNQTNTNMTMPAAASTNQTNTNMTMPAAASTNQTNTNMTMPAAASTNQTNTNMTMPAAASTNQTNTNPIPSTPLTPLKQFKSGVSAKDVQCKSGFSLILKASDGSPACVHSSSVQILIQRGWAAIQ